MAVTGGGSRAISELLEVPGASRTVLEAIVPYAAPALIAWLGAKPEHFCEPRTARAMAMVGFQRAGEYAALEAGDNKSGEAKAESATWPVAGVGCTASLASDRPKHGPHRAHVAAQTVSMTLTHTLELTKGRRTREEEEQVVAALVLNTVAEACGLDDRITLDLLPGEHVETMRTVAPLAWQNLLLGKTDAVRATDAADAEEPASARPRVGLARSSHPTLPSSAVSAESDPASAFRLPPSALRRLIFPGAFHPLHEGHRHMAKLAGERLGIPVEFEISIANVDKPPLDYTEMHARAQQFDRDQELWFTRAPTFRQKSQIFPGATFIVGADTIRRIADPCYYGDDPLACEAGISQIASKGCRFLVFGRKTDAGFQALSDLRLPESLRRICDEIPAEHFRHDVSSTDLRRAGKR